MNLRNLCSLYKMSKRHFNKTVKANKIHCVSTQKRLLKEIEGKGVSSKLESMTYFYGRCKLTTDAFKRGIKT